MKIQTEKDRSTDMEYEVKRTRRKTTALEVTKDGRVLVRTSLNAPNEEIRRFVERCTPWIEERLAAVRQRAEAESAVTPELEETLRRMAAKDLPARTARWAAVMGLCPRGVRITRAAARFGSCSGADRLCFSWRLMLYPEAARDYVVVHELAHIVHKNHSPQFHRLVAQYLPDHKARRRLLRELPKLPPMEEST